MNFSQLFILKAFRYKSRKKKKMANGYLGGNFAPRSEGVKLRYRRDMDSAIGGQEAIMLAWANPY